MLHCPFAPRLATFVEIAWINTFNNSTDKCMMLALNTSCIINHIIIHIIINTKCDKKYFSVMKVLKGPGLYFNEWHFSNPSSDVFKGIRWHVRLRKILFFFLPSDRSAVLHAHPVHRPYRRGRETLFLSAKVSGGYPSPAHVSGVPRRQPRGQGLSRLSHQTQRQIPALCGQWIWLPEQCSRETHWSAHAHEAASQ